MRSLITKQAERFLRERKNYKRWLAVFFCLAAMVTLGTVMVLRFTGTAMTGEPQCGLEDQEGHSHTDACYARGEEPADQEEVSGAQEDTGTEPATDAGTEPETDGGTEPETAADSGTEPDTVKEAQSQEETPAEQGADQTDGRYTLTMQGEDYVVSVFYGAEAGIPENAELVVEEILEGTEAYETYYQEMLAAMAQEAAGTEDAEPGAEPETEVSFARFFDISFVVNGEKVEPKAPVDIRISYPALAGLGEDEEASAVHFADEGVEVLRAQVTENEAGSDFDFTQESFSVTSTIISKAPNKGGTLTAKGDGCTITVNYGRDAGIPKDARLVAEEVKENGGSGNNSYRKYLNNSQGAIKEKTNHKDKEVESSFARVFELSIQDGNGRRLSTGQVEVRIQYQMPAVAESTAVAAMVLNTEDSGEVLEMEEMAAGEAVTVFSGRQSFSAGAPNVTATMVTNIDALSGEPSQPGEPGMNLDGMITSLKGAAKNEWQIVEGEYEGNAPENKDTPIVDNAPGSMRIQKNVIPTDVENVFYVYLSVDIKTIVESVFNPEHFGALTHKDNGQTGDHTNWSNKIDVRYKDIPQKWKKNHYVIKAPNGQIVHDGYVGWSQADNAILVFSPDNKTVYQIGGINTKDKPGTVITIPNDTWNAMKEEFETTIALDEVVDQMGEYIIYEGVVEADGTVLNKEAHTSAGGTITWKPQIKEGEYETEELTDGDGSGRTDVIWFKNVAELLYKVRLDVEKANFESCADHWDSAVGDKWSYPVNESAELSYRVKEADGTFSDTVTVPFQKPYVRGLLYDLPIVKKDFADGTTLLSGGEFILKDDQGNSVGETVTTDAEGKACFRGLPWGTYTIWETKAPEGYQAVPQEGKQIGGSFRLCYTETESRENLKAKEDGHMVYGSYDPQDPDKDQEGIVVTNEKIPPIILEKVWDDEENQAGLRPQEVTFVISGIDKGTGQEKSVEAVLRPDQDGKWRLQYDVIFEADSYTVTEKPVNNYEASPAEEGEENGLRVYTITNTQIEKRLLILKKSAESGGESSFLNGAVFALYRTDPGETDAKPMEGMDELISGSKEGKEGVIYAGTLPAGTYWLKETHAPDGYNELKEPIKITVKEDGNGIEIEDPNLENPLPGEIEAEDGVYTVTVLNRAGYELPETGGPGTTLYTFGGFAVLAAGLVYGFGRKRKQERGVR